MTEQQSIDIERIVSLHKTLWDKTIEKIDINLNGNLDIAKTIYAECCAYLRGQVMDMGKNKRMEEKRKEEQEKFNAVFKKDQGGKGTGKNQQPQEVLGTTKGTPTTSASGVDLPEKFSIVDPQNPNKVLFSVENGMAIEPNNGTYKGTLEPRASKTGAYYLLKGIGILTKNKNGWYLKDKRNDKWIIIGVLKT